MYFGHLAKSLAAEDNDVTAVMGSGMKILPEFTGGNIEWITYKMENPPITYSDRQVEAILKAYLGNGSMWESMKTMQTFMMDISDESMQIYDDVDLLERLSASKFDIAVLDTSILSYLYIPYRLDIPFATLALDVDPVMTRAPYYPSYVPPMISGWSDHMTFTQRTLSLLAYFIAPIVPNLVVSDTGTAHAERCAPGKAPMKYMDLYDQSSLYFTLRLPILHPVRPSIPNLFDLGRIMGRPSNLSNISPEMNDFIKKSPKGFIMVSFGSWLDKLPEEIMTKFLDAFASVDYSVIWKVSEIPNVKPNNIMFSKWIPQNDLLGHPKIKAFITHCGVSGTIETTYHGVPIVGFPLGIDQTFNAQLLSRRQVGVIMDITNFSPDDLLSAIINVTKDGNEFDKNIKKLSAILKDMPDAGKTASFWINHVAKHGRDHLRSAAYDLAWYQHMSLDSGVFLLFIFFITFKGLFNVL